MSCIIRHAFLSPSHNSWLLWTASGSQSITNDGTTHRVYETLVYAIDKLSEDGWHVENIYVDGGAPTLVLLAREEQPTPAGG